MSPQESNRGHAGALSLRDVHDAALLARSHAVSARELTRDEGLSIARLDAAITTLDRLIADLRWGGLAA
jgi:hypothetical protein